MEQRPDDLFGMTRQAAVEYVAGHIASLKLTEKKLADLDANFKKWTDRVELARSKGLNDLVGEAEHEIERIKSERDALAAEAAELSRQIENMKKQLPTLGAYERSIDPDLLEQELLVAVGRMPGDEAAVDVERKLSTLEKNESVDAELAALKAKLKEGDIS